MGLRTEFSFMPNPSGKPSENAENQKTTFLYLEGPWWHFPPANGIFLHAESKWETQRECGKPKKNKKKPKQNHFPLLGGAMVAFSSCERNFPSCRIQVGNPARMRKTKKKTKKNQNKTTFLYLEGP